MGTAVVPDVDLTVLEDLDFDAPCIIKIVRVAYIFGLTVPMNDPGECPNPAAWSLTCRRCGGGAVMCAEHHEQVLSLPIATCGHCDRTGPVLAMFLFTEIQR